MHTAGNIHAWWHVRKHIHRCRLHVEHCDTYIHTMSTRVTRFLHSGTEPRGWGNTYGHQEVAKATSGFWHNYFTKSEPKCDSSVKSVIASNCNNSTSAGINISGIQKEASKDQDPARQRQPNCSHYSLMACRRTMKMSIHRKQVYVEKIQSPIYTYNYIYKSI